MSTKSIPAQLAFASHVSSRGPRRVLVRGWAALAVAAAVVVSSGCAARGEAGAPSSGAAGSDSVLEIAIVTPEKESDHGWNQQGLFAARTVAQELGLTLNEHDNVGYDNTDQIMEQVAAGNTQLVIAHASGFNTSGLRIGEKTGVPTLVVDYENNVPGKVATILTHAEEGGYLAGVAAAHETKSGIVGIVASAEDLNWFQTAGGFAQGARSVNPDISVIMTYVGPAAYGDSAGGKAAATQVIAAGADVIIGMGDGATLGYLQAVETADAEYPVRYIATIGDVSEAVSSPETVLTSVLWDFSESYRQAIADIEAGTFGEQTYELTVGNGGLTLQGTEGLATQTQAAVEQATRDITSGAVQVASSATKAEVQDRVEGK